jgi:hypothetical protein
LFIYILIIVFLPILFIYTCTIFNSSTIFYVGFDKDETFKACCGGGGPHNFDPRMGCGSPITTVCSDPSKNINWDGVHFTEAAYKLLAKGLVEGPFAYPSLKPAPFQIA